MAKPKLIRITTVPLSLDKVLAGQLSFMNQYFEVIGVSADQKYLEQIGEKEGIRVKPIEMTRAITPIKDAKAIYELYKFLKKEKPSIIHSHTPKAGLVAMIAGKMARVPLRIHTVAGLPLMEAKGKKRMILNSVEKLIYKAAHKVYPNSQGLKNFILQEKFCSPSKLKVLANGSSNGINTSYFHRDVLDKDKINALKKDLSINEDEFVFVFVGRIVKDKGINELMEAFQQLSQQNKKVKLILVGPYEDDLDPINDTSRDIVLNNELVVSVGYQNDVRPYLAIANALIFPSYREGFPNVVMQAGAMGLPSIVSNINGSNEIIVEGENGTIIPVKSTDAIYSAMISFIENKSLYQKMKQNARQMIVERYEQKVIWEAILSEYESLLHPLNISL